jgi:hypothetical protein
VTRTYCYRTVDGGVDARAKRRRRLKDVEALVCVIENDGNRVWLVERGPAFSEKLWQLALLDHVGVRPSTTNKDLGRLVPHAVVAELSRRISDITRSLAQDVARNWHNIGGETDLVAFALPHFNTEFESSAWKVAIRPQVFSSQVKEPHIGADLGWLVDIGIGRQHVSKAIWMQAKRTVYDVTSVPDMFKLKDFSKQFAQMRSRTPEAFGLVFTPDEILVGDDKGLSTLDSLLTQVVICARGDRRQEIVAETVERYHVVVVDIDGSRRSTSERGVSLLHRSDVRDR